MLLLGGNSVEADITMLRDKGANIIIATPGRLEDILEHHTDVCLKPALKSLVSSLQFLPLIEDKIYNNFN